MRNYLSAEVTSNRGLRASLMVRSALVGAGILALSVASAASAAPAGFNSQVAAGETAATWSGPGAAQTVTVGSNRTVVNWNTFNVGAAESVLFNFTGRDASRAIVFNRVITNSSATIDGALYGRIGALVGDAVGGNIWLYAPGGIVFGATSVVSANGFLASTVDLNGADLSSFLQVSGAGGLGATNEANFTIAGAGGSITTATGATFLGGAAGTTKGMLAFISPELSLGELKVGNAQIIGLAAAGGKLKWTDGAAQAPRYSDFGSVIGSTSATPITTTGALQAGSVFLAAHSANSVATALMSLGKSVTADGATADKAGNVTLYSSKANIEVNDNITANRNISINGGGDVSISAVANLSADANKDSATLAPESLTITAAGKVVALPGSTIYATDTGSAVARVANVTITGTDVSVNQVRGSNIKITATTGAVKTAAMRANSDLAGSSIEVTAATDVDVLSVANNGAKDGTVKLTATAGKLNLGSANLNVSSAGGDELGASLRTRSALDSTIGAINVNGMADLVANGGAITVADAKSDSQVDVRGNKGATVTAATVTNTGAVLPPTGNLSVVADTGNATIVASTTQGAVSGVATTGDVIIGSATKNIIAATTATFIATAGNVDIKGSVTADGQVFLQAGKDVMVASTKTVTADADLSNGGLWNDNLVISAAGDLKAKGANLFASASNNASGSNVYINAASVDVAAVRGRTVSVVSTKGDVTAAVIAGYTGNDPLSMTASVVSAGNATIDRFVSGANGEVFAVGDAKIGTGAAATDGVSTRFDLSVGAGGAVTIGKGVTTNTSPTPGTIIPFGPGVGGKATISGSTVALASTGTLDVVGALKATSTTGAVSTVKVVNAGSLTLTSKTSTDIADNANVQGTTLINAGTDVTIASTKTVTGNLNGTAVGGEMKINAAGEVKAAGAVLATAPSAFLVPQPLSASGQIFVNAGKGVTLAGARGTSVAVVTTTGDALVDAVRARDGSASVVATVGSVVMQSIFANTVSGGAADGVGDVSVIAGKDATISGSTSAENQAYFSSNGVTTVGSVGANKGNATIIGKSVLATGDVQSSNKAVNIIATAGGVTAQSVEAFGASIANSTVTINATDAIVVNGVYTNNGHVGITGGSLKSANAITSNGGNVSISTTKGDIFVNGGLNANNGLITAISTGKVSVLNTSSGGNTFIQGTDIIVLSSVTDGGSVKMNGSGALLVGNITTYGGAIDLTGKSINAPFTLTSSGGDVTLNATGGNLDAPSVSTGPGTCSATATGTVNAPTC